MEGVALRWVSADDPVMRHVDDLRYEVLFEPFGVERDDGWADAVPGTHHVVAMAGERVVAYGCLLVSGREGQVRQVSVAEDAQRKGIGSALMLDLERHARSLGLTYLHLHARVPAEGFYHSLGWSTRPGDPFPSGRTGLPHVYMEKLL